jgi:hypothetical protein
MYSLKLSFHPSASCSLTTPRTTATPLFRSSWLNSSGALSTSLKSISGMIFEPFSIMSGISSRRSLSNRSHDARKASSFPLTRRALRSAYSGASGANCWPESDANASEMSPARLEAACVAAVRFSVRMAGDRTVREMDNMLDGLLLLLQYSNVVAAPQESPHYIVCDAPTANGAGFELRRTSFDE